MISEPTSDRGYNKKRVVVVVVFKESIAANVT